jgi:hypothetical protein
VYARLLRQTGSAVPTVSPELGIEKSSDHSHFPVVISSRSEWAARHRDSQGATHSNWSIIRRSQIHARPLRFWSGQDLLPLDRVRQTSFTKPERGRSFLQCH